MPGQNKTPLLGWHPPAELSAWVRAEAARRETTIAAVLNEAVETLRHALDPLDGDRHARCVQCGCLSSVDCEHPCARCPYCGVRDHGTGAAHWADCVRAPATQAEIDEVLRRPLRLVDDEDAQARDARQ